MSGRPCLRHPGQLTQIIWWTRADTGAEYQMTICRRCRQESGIKGGIAKGVAGRRRQRDTVKA